MSRSVDHEGGSRRRDTALLWVMMAGCCLAVPLALILSGAGLASLTGASPWLIGTAAVLALALVITHRLSRASGSDGCDTHHEKSTR